MVGSPNTWITAPHKNVVRKHLYQIVMVTYVVPKSVGVCQNEETSIDLEWHVPIPMTVPYSDFLSSSAFTATGHRRMSAKKATKKIEREEATRRAWDRVGRRGSRDIVGVWGREWLDDVGRRFRVLYIWTRALPRSHVVYNKTRH